MHSTTQAQGNSNTVNRIKYRDKVLLEQVRLWEEANDTQLGADSSAPTDLQSGSFTQRLTDRARKLVDQEQIVTSRPSRLHRLFIAVACTLFALLGILAIINALDRAGNAINVYWLLLVLLGFNGLALLVWLAATVSGGTEGLVGKIPQLLINHLPKRQHSNQDVSQWLGIVYQGATGQWRVSVLTHLLWWCYLAAGLVMLVAVLSVRQYDFYWGSTLLSTEQFSKLVSLLSAPLAAMGLPTPDPGLFSSSQVGDLAMDQQQRQQWAYFLMSFLLLYGLVPRFMAALICWWFLKRAENHFEPDFYLPYYVQLRHQIMPEGGAAVVVDADQEPPPKQTDNPKPATSRPLSSEQHFVLIGVELGADLMEKVDSKVDNNVTSQQTLTEALDFIDSNQNDASNIAIVVHMANLPDRGVRRKINSLVESVEKKRRWLILLDSTDNITPNVAKPNAGKQERQQDWFQAASQANIPMEQVVYTSPDKLRQPALYQPQQGAD